MEIRQTQVRELFKSRYPWAEEITVTDNTDWTGSSEETTKISGPHWVVDVNDEGVWRKFIIQIEVEEV